ncbi:unnamed protein product, partial [marine sediment metagenome]
MPLIKLKKFQKTSKGRYYYGTGRRKSATARVRIIPGKGDMIINEKKPEEYFESKFLIELILNPLKLVGLEKKVDVSVLVAGGGKNAQAEAIRLGLSRAIISYKKNLKTTFKKSGFLTQDAREKERMKPGLKRARRAPSGE